MITPAKAVKKALAKVKEDAKHTKKEYEGLQFDYNHLLSFVVSKGLGREFDDFPVSS